MQNYKKLLLLLLVLTPSLFFLGKAFSGNSVAIENGRLVVSGPGGFEIALEDIQSVERVQTLPEMRNAGNFSLGLIKKGNFIREGDEVEIRVIENNEYGYIYLNTQIGEVYFNLRSEEETLSIYEALLSAAEN